MNSKIASIKGINLPEAYQKLSPEAKEKAIQKITKRLKQMPRSYQTTYRKALTGNSLRSAINTQCLECVGWQRKEVTLCTDLACPLYVVRPYQMSDADETDDCSNLPIEKHYLDSELTNTDEGADYEE